MVLIPPVSGSVTVIDRVCGELRDEGFTVATYSRRGFDSPAIGPDGKKHSLSLNKRVQLFRAERRGRAMAAANAIGCSLEEGRRRDIAFLLDRLRQNRPQPVFGTNEGAIAAALAETDLSMVFLVGYDAGGTAILELSGSPDFAARYPAVKGVIAVESPLFSVLTREEVPVVPPPHDNWFIAAWLGLRSRAMALRPRKITGIGEVPRPGVPVCFILSDRVAEPRHRNDRYAAILKVFRTTGAPAILAAASGAGPLDYSDIPEKYPIYPVLQPGSTASPLRSLTRGTHGPGEIAALMTNFAIVILAAGPEEAKGAGLVPLRKPLSSRNFHIETNNAWNSLKKGSIL
jgi:hypothetical protein